MTLKGFAVFSDFYFYHSEVSFALLAKVFLYWFGLYLGFKMSWNSYCLGDTSEKAL